MTPNSTECKNFKFLNNNLGQILVENSDYHALFTVGSLTVSGLSYLTGHVKVAKIANSFARGSLVLTFSMNLTHAFAAAYLDWMCNENTYSKASETIGYSLTAIPRWAKAAQNYIFDQN